MGYLLGCFSILLLLAVGYAVGWYFWPRLQYARDMQNPLHAERTRHETEERLFELERQRVQLELEIEERSANVDRIRAETDVARRVVRLNRHQSAFTVDGEFYYAPTEPKMLNAPEPSGDDSTVFHIRKLFSQLVQVYAIVGGQQVGKTFQARHVVSDWQRSGVECWVVGPKWDKGEWQNCRMFGGKANYAAVASGLDAVLAEAERRHGDESRGHKEHAPLVVVLDDWTPIVEHCDNAKSFIFNATTLFASVNVILIFLIHSDTSDAWGTSKKGAALTHGFIKAYLKPSYSGPNGKIDRTKTTAEVWLPGSAGRVPLELESAPVSWPTVPAVPTDQATPLAVPSPSAPPSPTVPKIAERYEGRERDVALCILKGWSKTQTREAVKGKNEKIGQLYERIKAEIEAAKLPPKESMPEIWGDFPGIEEKANGGLH